MLYFRFFVEIFFLDEFYLKFTMEQSPTTVDQKEMSFFKKYSELWWNKDSKMHSLFAMNVVR